MALEYIVYADESVTDGKFFWNFYGGCLVTSKDLNDVESALHESKKSLNLFGEVKWQKVTVNYVSKYENLLDVFFDLVESSKIKVRVMFTQNRNVATNLTPRQREDAYFLLYYQFVKHAFGLAYADHGLPSVAVRIYLDALPDTYEKRARFRGYLADLTRFPKLRDARIVIDEQQIAEVDSREHVLLQCTDLVLGAMQFRLNRWHEEKVRRERRRGSRTIAKERLYKSILSRVRRLHGNFNPGISTGTRGDVRNRWRDPYRHWLFVPHERERDSSGVTKQKE
jgi:hypothetical protein